MHFEAYFENNINNKITSMLLVEIHCGSRVDKIYKKFGEGRRKYLSGKQNGHMTNDPLRLVLEN